MSVIAIYLLLKFIVFVYAQVRSLFARKRPIEALPIPHSHAVASAADTLRAA